MGTSPTIGLDLSWRVSPRDAAGARVVVHADADFVRTDQSYLGHSYSSCSPLTFNFGLGDRTSVDSVEFFWPSGWTVLEDPADQYHRPGDALPGGCRRIWIGRNPLSSVRAIRSFSPYRMGGPPRHGPGLWMYEGRAHTEAGVAQALLAAGNGCAILTDGLRVTVVPAVPPTVALNGRRNSCSGTLRQLTVQGPQVDIQWSKWTDGACIDPCRFRYPDRDHHQCVWAHRHLRPRGVVGIRLAIVTVVPPATVAIGGLHTFEPIVLDEAVLRWYAPYGPGALDDLLAGTTDQVGPFIIESPTYPTPPLGATTGCGLRSEINGMSAPQMEPKATSSSGGFINADTYGLQFDAHEPVVLEQVRMRADFAGPRTVQLTQPGLGSSPVRRSNWWRWNEVELGFDIAR